MPDDPKSATDELLAEVSATVRAVLARRFPGTSWDIREDLEQAVRLKILKRPADGKKIEHPRSYLWRVVFTTTLDFLAQRGTELSLDETDDSGRRRLDPVLVFDGRNSDRRLDLERRIEALSQDRRRVIKLSLIGYGLEEIAGMLHWSKARVRHLYYRGLEDLKKAIIAEDEDAYGRNPDRLPEG